MTTSRHLRTDRAERAAYILANVGLGAVVATAPARENGAEYRLTEKGVLLVVGADEKVITMYLPNLAKLRVIFNSALIPSYMYGVFKRNQKHRDYLAKNGL